MHALMTNFLTGAVFRDRPVFLFHTRTSDPSRRQKFFKTDGIRVSTFGPTRARAVTYLDVSRSQTEEALDIIRGVADKAKSGR